MEVLIFFMSRVWIVGNIENIKNGVVTVKKKDICFMNVLKMQDFRKGDYVVVEGYLLDDVVNGVVVKKLHGKSIIHWDIGKIKL